MINAKTVLFFESLDCKGNKGYQYALRAYEESVEMKTDMIIVKELPWGTNLAEEMCDFYSILTEAEVERIIVTDHSTALLEGLIELMNLGCKIVEPFEDTIRGRFCDENLKGLVIKL